MDRHQIDSDQYMQSLLSDAKKQRIPVVAIYTVLENGKLFLRIISNTTEKITAQLWAQISPTSDAAIETAAKALAAMESQDWNALDEGARNACRAIARTAVTAAASTHAPKLPSAEPSPIISPS